MFTGIINIIAPVVYIKKNNYYTHTISLPNTLSNNLTIGSSIAENGCCLTITTISNTLIAVDIIQETLNLTNLKKIKIGDLVNIELPANFNSKINGHIILGHIVCTATIYKINLLKNYKQIWFKLNDKNFQKYLMHKDSIGIDGVSLTIAKIVKNTFCIYFIPETLKRTTFYLKKTGDLVNIEINTMTKTIIDTVTSLCIKILKNNVINKKIKNKRPILKKLI